MGRIITVSGPRGVGKTTILDRLRDDYGIASITPFTTRAMRPGEVDGQDYTFVDPATFAEVMETSPIFDILQSGGNLYGTPERVIDDVLESDATKTFNVAGNTAMKLRKYGGELVRTVMLLPASWENIRGQMRDGGASEEEIEHRIQSEPTDLTQLPLFDQIIVNKCGNLDTTVEDILRYIRSLT